MRHDKPNQQVGREAGRQAAGCMHVLVSAAATALLYIVNSL
jgi:hypothetical protein